MLNKKNKSCEMILLGLAAMLIVVICISIATGRYPITLKELFTYLCEKISGVNILDYKISSIIGNIRFPRIIAAVMVGAALAMSGASYQGIFQNPMVSPDILGASAGASFGAALGILLNFSGTGIQLVSFVCGLSAVFISYGISSIIGQRENVTLVLVLSGMVISSLFSSFISITKYVADPYSKLPEITFWLMGSLSSVTNADIKIVLFPVGMSMAVLMLVRWRLNVLVFGDEEASALGVNTRRLRLVVIICATMLTASVVSISGQIGWIGLIIPHLTRMILGADYKYLMPGTLLIGSIYLLIMDNIARNVFMVEIPIGILTAIIGAPFFIYLLLKGKRGWL